MKSNCDRILVLLVLSTLSLSALALSSAQGPRAQTFEISPITFDPDPGFTCGDTNINFTVTNRMATVVDLITVNVSAKSSVGSQQWGTNITTLAANQSKAMSFKWKTPAAGTYDIAVRVMGMGQIVIVTTVYTVSVCGPHITFGTVSFATNPGPFCQNGTLSIAVINNGHAVATNTSVFVSAYGPFPEMTRLPIGSTTVASIGVGASVKVDFLWTPLPVPGVYSIEVLTIDAFGQVASSDTSVTVPVCPISDVRISNITFDPYPGQWGHDAAVNVTVQNAGTEQATSVKVTLSATGPANHTFGTQVVPLLEKGARVKVKFFWDRALPPGTYSVQAFISTNEGLQTSSSTSFVYLAPPSSGVVVNVTKAPRVVLSGLLIDPLPGSVSKDVTVKVLLNNIGDASSGLMTMSLAAVGPQDYNIGNQSVAELAPGAWSNLTFHWKQPIMPGSYSIYAFLASKDGSSSSGSAFFVELGASSGQVLQNGTYYYYNYGQPVNGTIKLEPRTLNVTVKTDKVTQASGTDMAVAGISGAAIGGLISVVGILGVLAMQKKSGSTSSSDPYPDPKDSMATSKGDNRGSMQGSDFGINEQGVKRSYGGEELPKESKFAIKENGVKSPSVRGSLQDSTSMKKKQSGLKAREGAVQYRESDFAIKENGVKSPSRRGSLQSASEDREDYTGKATGRGRESPTLASTGQTTVRESPTKSSLRESPTKSSLRESPSKSSLRESPSKGSAIRESPTEPSRGGQQRSTRPTGDLDGDGRPDDIAPRDSSSGHASGREASRPSISERSSDYSQATGQTSDIRESPSNGSALRESPTLASKGQTSLRESPTKSTLRESPSKASTGETSSRESPTLSSTDPAKGQTTGKRIGIGDTPPESPLGKIEQGVDEAGQAKETFETGDKPTESQISQDAGKKDYRGHVTLMK